MSIPGPRAPREARPAARLAPLLPPATWACAPWPALVQGPGAHASLVWVGPMSDTLPPTPLPARAQEESGTNGGCSVSLLASGARAPVSLPFQSRRPWPPWRRGVDGRVKSRGPTSGARVVAGIRSGAGVAASIGCGPGAHCQGSAPGSCGMLVVGPPHPWGPWLGLSRLSRPPGLSNYLPFYREEVAVAREPRHHCNCRWLL